uniref:Uncharacterized protein n=1 Tax=Helianthus annuus TaxID=4232 RepID=A0A251SGM9_HELAN
MRAIGSPQCKIQKIRTHKKSRNHQIPGFEVAGYQDLYFAVQITGLIELASQMPPSLRYCMYLENSGLAVAFFLPLLLSNMLKNG